VRPPTIDAAPTRLTAAADDTNRPIATPASSCARPLCVAAGPVYPPARDRRQEIREAPEFDADTLRHDEEFRGRLGDYYGRKRAPGPGRRTV
jgi:hypothetical protein